MFTFSFIYQDELNPDYDTWALTHWNKYSWKLPIMLFISLCLVPLCMLKDISKMRFTSLFSICSLIYAIIIIVIQCPFYYSNYINNIYNPDDETTHVNFFDISKGFDHHLFFFQGTATIIFSFTCHVGAFPVYKSLKNNVTKRINKVFMNSIIFDVVVYIFVGIAGYLTEPVNTHELIIYRTSVFESDIFMVIARLGIALNLIFSIPPNFNSLRLSALELFWGVNEVSNKK